MSELAFLLLLLSTATQFTQGLQTIIDQHQQNHHHHQQQRAPLNDVDVAHDVIDEPQSASAPASTTKRKRSSSTTSSTQKKKLTDDEEREVQVYFMLGYSAAFLSKNYHLERVIAAV